MGRRFANNRLVVGALALSMVMPISSVRAHSFAAPAVAPAQIPADKSAAIKLEIVAKRPPLALRLVELTPAKNQPKSLTFDLPKLVLCTGSCLRPTTPGLHTFVVETDERGRPPLSTQACLGAGDTVILRFHSREGARRAGKAVLTSGAIIGGTVATAGLMRMLGATLWRNEPLAKNGSQDEILFSVGMAVVVVSVTVGLLQMRKRDVLTQYVQRATGVRH